MNQNRSIEFSVDEISKLLDNKTFCFFITLHYKYQSVNYQPNRHLTTPPSLPEHKMLEFSFSNKILKFVLACTMLANFMLLLNLKGSNTFKMFLMLYFTTNSYEKYFLFIHELLKSFYFKLISEIFAYFVIQSQWKKHYRKIFCTNFINWW